MLSLSSKIEYRTCNPDHKNRIRFFLNWVDSNDNKKSQVFFANPENYGHKMITIIYKFTDTHVCYNEADAILYKSITGFSYIEIEIN